ncbi:DUF3090 family protein [Raineyella fluvialis]|uniref:DUF3090 family protein n=1 Tax=Raineyella fluvialis TaxID=2662261 RepID=A0A5Q2FER3_9ACTN|nr:DUF3090 family protein [Raineyella fluvialis]QGF24881.1 DUF3090 family protein [Raineyella fluvialis]
MAAFTLRYDHPDRFVAGTVGEPGDRMFFLQVREADRLSSLVCEKQQVEVLANQIAHLLDEVSARSLSGIEIPPPVAGAADTRPLDAPISEDFRIGPMSLAWDSRHDKVVLELFSDDVEEAITAVGEIDTDALEEGVVCIIGLTPADARQFVARAQAVVAAGRPVCPFCRQPMDPDGHVCPRSNGYVNPLA